MKLNAYLGFDGQCEAAFRFYAQCLGGTIEALNRFGDTPACDHAPETHRNRIMHAHLVVGDQALMGSDSVPDHPCEGIKGCSVALNVDSVAEAERVYAALSEGGKVIMPMDKTFWSARFGMFVDRFGVPWMVNCEKDA
ncbi:VOC family protein [Lysobacter sp. LF1]|uniref:VOC family protein n=1 Tax=Lysobacter stagni TaxID=3045172 RepID=A0ABT6XGJ9_9GAMM|nr:VOC family protein [Lysobacter sp. LF1]MDI9239179.1 VOC family protein [Lysobacter sp. LF1]